MNSMERVLAVLNNKEVDRIPLFLLFSLYGAKEAKMNIKDYFLDIDKVVETQIKMRQKYSTDCFYTFSYASIEFEAFGGETIFRKDCPPNAGSPVINSVKDIDNLKTPIIDEAIGLNRVLEVTRRLSERDCEVPIIGVVLGPFSLPVMQIGFDEYIKLIYNDRDRFDKLMNINKEFVVNWANAQIKAGATAICYFNPLASSEMIDSITYHETGYLIDKEVVNRINGPTAFHLAAASSINSLTDIENIGSPIVGISNKDSINEVHDNSNLTVLGNFSGIKMVNWSIDEAKKEVKDLLKNCKSTEKLIIADNHGEIPWQVNEEVLLAIAEAVNEYGSKY